MWTLYERTGPQCCPYVCARSHSHRSHSERGCVYERGRALTSSTCDTTHACALLNSSSVQTNSEIMWNRRLLREIAVRFWALHVCECVCDLTHTKIIYHSYILLAIQWCTASSFESTHGFFRFSFSLSCNLGTFCSHKTHCNRVQFMSQSTGDSNLYRSLEKCTRISTSLDNDLRQVMTEWTEEM